VLIDLILASSSVLAMATGAASLGDGTVASADGVRVRYHVEGKGEPALVFVHCWTCDRRFWDAQLQAFAPRHRVVTLDLGGHGESSRDRKDWSIEAYGADVRAVVEKLDLGRVILIGHSMGGPIILEAARTMLGRVAALIPVDALTNVGERVKPEELEAFLKPFEADYRSTTSKFLREYMFVPGTDAGLIDRIVEKSSAAPPEIAVASLRHAFLYDAAAALRATTVPIRALNADRFPTNLEAARRYAPQFDAVIMKGVGHYPMLEDPARFNQLLREIVDGFAPASSSKPR
jgi:pimeloyl-ACP methyl ester carboxylesterase